LTFDGERIASGERIDLKARTASGLEARKARRIA
jgi:hypothetical protein